MQKEKDFLNHYVEFSHILSPVIVLWKKVHGTLVFEILNNNKYLYLIDSNKFALLFYVYDFFFNNFLQLFIRKYSIDEITVCRINIIYTSKPKSVNIFLITISSTIINYIIYLNNVWFNKLIIFNNTIFFLCLLEIEIWCFSLLLIRIALSYILQYHITAFIYQEDIHWK